MSALMGDNPSERKPDRFGAWVVDRVIGRGATGTVYRCHHERSTRIVAAVKAFDRGDWKSARIVREAEVLFGLDHPNIVQVRGADFTNDPPYIELEHVDGPTLDSVIAHGPVPLDRALAYFAQLADAIAMLHRRQIYHRDIKPSNLIINREDGRLKLVDFGIAQDATAPSVTDEEAVFGTIAYVPPEWASPPVRNPAQWDVYAMGVVLYEMLTGERPFASAAAGGFDRVVEVMAQKAVRAPLDPGPGVPEPIRHLVRKMTHADPARRTRSAMEVLEWLSAAGIPGWAPRTALPTFASLDEAPSGSRSLPHWSVPSLTDAVTVPAATERIERPAARSWRRIPRASIAFLLLAAALLLGLLLTGCSPRDVQIDLLPWARP